MLKSGITKKNNARLRSGEGVRTTGNKDRKAAKETSETNVRCRQSKSIGGYSAGIRKKK